MRQGREVHELLEAALAQVRAKETTEFCLTRIELYRLMNSDLANPRSGADYVVDPEKLTICGIPIVLQR